MSAKETIKRIVDSFNSKPQLKDKTREMGEGLMLGASLADDANELSKDVQAQVNQLVVEGDSSVEAAQARVDATGKAYPTLKGRLDLKEQETAAQFAQKAPISYVDNLVSPKASTSYVNQLVSSLSKNGPYDAVTTVAALNSKYPNGAPGPILVFENNHSYIWNEGVWKDFGLYQGIEVADESLTHDKFMDNSIHGTKLALEGEIASVYISPPYSEKNPILIVDNNGVKFGEVPVIRLIYRNRVVICSLSEYVIDVTSLGYVYGLNYWVYVNPDIKTFYIGQVQEEVISETALKKIRESVSLGYVVSQAGVGYLKRQESQIEIPILDDGIMVFKNKYKSNQKAGRLVERTNTKSTIDYVNRKLIIARGEKFLVRNDSFDWIVDSAGTRITSEIEVPFVAGDFHYLFYDPTRLTFSFKLPAEFSDWTTSDMVYLGFLQSADKFNYLNIDVNEIKLSGTGGKILISFLGDSISTFKDYIPGGNAVYYPKPFLDNVNDTYWMKLINSVPNMELLVNNSWSGSRVSTVNGEASAGVNRVLNLGKDGKKPNIIVNWLSVNDLQYNVPTGEYDGTQEFPTSTTTIKESMVIMYRRMAETYPEAKIFVCTLPAFDRNTQNDFPEVNGNGWSLLEHNEYIRFLAKLFGYEVIDLESCGITKFNLDTYLGDLLHPNKQGHELIYRAMKPVLDYAKQILATAA